MKSKIATLSVLALIAGTSSAAVAGSWPRRHANPQNTGDVGEVTGLSPATAADLRVLATIPLSPLVNATPIVSGGLAFIGESTNHFNVVDLATGKTLVSLLAGTPISPGSVFSYTGIQSTATLATVTVPEGTVSREENRVYIGGYSATKTLWCLNVDRIAADRDALLVNVSDGTAYVCPSFPISLAGPGSTNPTFHGTPLFSRDQRIMVNGVPEFRDVLYAPSTGIDCANGVLWAIDAATGQKIAMWDPVVLGDGLGGVIWFSPAMSKDGTKLYVTTGDCVTKPQAGENAESIIALDPEDIGNTTPLWFHQRRLVDTADVDVGNGPTVADVDGVCHTVVSIDKDGCFYAFDQSPDVPQVGEPGFDPLRIGQQRVLWRTCFVPGGIEGGFNANAAVFHDRWVFAQASGNGRYGITPRVPTDNAHGFLVDACTGEMKWATAAIGWGMGEAAVASGMIFQPAGYADDFVFDDPRLQVFAADPTYALLATVTLPSPPTVGGGGPSIVDGKVYVPLRDGGIAVVGVDPGSHASPPRDVDVVFGGPYREPLWWSTNPRIDPANPY